MLKLLLAHLVDVRDLVSVFIQERDVKDGLQLLAAIIAYIGLRSAGLQELIPLFPYPDGMGLDPRKILQIFYREDIHTEVLQERVFFVEEMGG